MEHGVTNERDRIRTDWQQHLDNSQRSGRTQQDYCRANSFALATFGYWCRRLKVNELIKPRFYPLVVPTEAGAEVVHHDHSEPCLALDRLAIEIGGQFSPAVLQKLFASLEQL